MGAKIVAIANYKGGTAKTTTALNLAYEAANRGKRVLLLDADSSANATIGVKADPVKGMPPLLLSIGEEPEQSLQEGIVRAGDWGFDLLPSGKRMTFIGQLLEELVEPSRALQALLRGLDGYDLVVVDCPAQFGVMTRLVLAAAHDVVVPIDCKSADSLGGLVTLWRDVKLAEKKNNPGLAVCAVLPCRADRTRLTKQVLKQLETHGTFGPLLPRREDGSVVVLHESVGVAEARMRQLPVAKHDRGGRGAKDFADLATVLWGEV